MDDLISRAAAIDDLHGKDPSQIWDTADIEVWVNALPPAQPEKRTEERTETYACDCISRQAALDALDVLCQEHRYKIPGKGETYSQYNEAWQDALDRAEGAIFNLPSAQPERMRGTWVRGIGEYAKNLMECSECRRTFYYNAEWNFCPNCGAEMEAIK